MKKIILFGFAIFLLSGCGAAGLEKLASCGECVQGLQELKNVQNLTPMIEKYVAPREE